VGKYFKITLSCRDLNEECLIHAGPNATMAKAVNSTLDFIKDKCPRLAIILKSYKLQGKRFYNHKLCDAYGIVCRYGPYESHFDYNQPQVSYTIEMRS